ncbi:Uncharacterised protein [Chlamydia trachomatis]|nr:Uncharacterised protein [Chlamydia trachomatis]
MAGKSKDFACSRESEAQTIPVVWDKRKLIFSVETFSPARIKSPSFSRDAASITMTNFPSATSFIACCTDAIPASHVNILNLPRF